MSDNPANPQDDAERVSPFCFLFQVVSIHICICTPTDPSQAIGKAPDLKQYKQYIAHPDF